ncbi:MAG: M15 family metallopeptidase [Bacilli bacterium]|nr:M15 family metallopeptidase [Bacilli bacterium]
MEDRTFTTSKGYQAVIKNGILYIDGYMISNKSYYLPSNYGSGLTSDTIKAFNIMKEAAKEEGLNIYISSGFRSYSTQKKLYNNYVARDGVAEADTYSARPGHSEHQSGLAFDVNTINNSFANTPEGKWLTKNAYKYGFILRYPKGKTNETGYIYEPWHFRYVGKELATKLYNNGDWITLEDYFGITSSYN